MNTWFQDAGTFFKRYVFIVLAVVLIGNLIAWKNQDKKENYYEYVIKVRARVDYYDLVRSRFLKIASDVLEKYSGQLKSAPIESYRNENFYFIEMKLRFADTIPARSILTNTFERIRSDAELKEKYFSQLESYDKLAEESKALIREAANAPGAQSSSDMMSRKSLFELRMKEADIPRYKIKLEEKIQVYFPSFSELTFVEKQSSSGVFLTATILFFIIGLFIAVVIDRFRN